MTQTQRELVDGCFDAMPPIIHRAVSAAIARLVVYVTLGAFAAGAIVGGLIVAVLS